MNNDSFWWIEPDIIIEILYKNFYGSFSLKLARISDILQYNSKTSENFKDLWSTTIERWVIRTNQQSKFQNKMGMKNEFFFEVLSIEITKNYKNILVELLEYKNKNLVVLH